MVKTKKITNQKGGFFDIFSSIKKRFNKQTDKAKKNPLKFLLLEPYHHREGRRSWIQNKLFGKGGAKTSKLKGSGKKKSRKHTRHKKRKTRKHKR